MDTVPPLVRVIHTRATDAPVSDVESHISRVTNVELRSTYRAIKAANAGHFELTQKTLQVPEPRRVRVRVEACEICRSDAATVEGKLPIAWPRVPGHNAIGRIEEPDSGIQGRAIGQPVAAGFIAGLLRPLGVM